MSVRWGRAAPSARGPEPSCRWHLSGPRAGLCPQPPHRCTPLWTDHGDSTQDVSPEGTPAWPPLQAAVSVRGLEPRTGHFVERSPRARVWPRDRPCLFLAGTKRAARALRRGLWGAGLGVTVLGSRRPPGHLVAEGGAQGPLSSGVLGSRVSKGRPPGLGAGRRWQCPAEAPGLCPRRPGPSAPWVVTTLVFFYPGPVLRGPGVRGGSSSSYFVLTLPS